MIHCSPVDKYESGEEEIFCDYVGESVQCLYISNTFLQNYYYNNNNNNNYYYYCVVLAVYKVRMHVL